MRTPGQLDWLVDDLTARVPAVTAAVLLSRDGLTMASSATVTREDAEYVAAAASGFQSLARGTSHNLGGGAVRQTVIEMEALLLFIMAAGEGSCLAVVAEQGADLGQIAYEMTLLIRQVGHHLGVGHRAPSRA